MLYDYIFSILLMSKFYFPLFPSLLLLSASDTHLSVVYSVATTDSVRNSALMQMSINSLKQNEQLYTNHLYLVSHRFCVCVRFVFVYLICSTEPTIDSIIERTDSAKDHFLIFRIRQFCQMRSSLVMLAIHKHRITSHSLHHSNNSNICNRTTNHDNIGFFMINSRSHQWQNWFHSKDNWDKKHRKTMSNNSHVLMWTLQCAFRMRVYVLWFLLAQCIDR